MRAYIFADVLRRVLELRGYSVCHVMNITDVGHLTDDADHGEDKLVAGAKREKTTAWALAKHYEQIFFDDCQKLNISRPTILCRATDHIAEQINMITTLEEKGYTYKTSDGIYFDTSLFPRYGEFAHLDVDGLRAGERVELGEKRHKTDFALWKFSPAGVTRDMEWGARWGKGFPGWHIECSAMSTHYLGKQFDIHTGGTDHIPIHHTNEIAQSECAHSSHPFVNYWLHAQFLVFPSGEKVSKSSGHDLSINRLVEMNVDPLAYRYLCLTAHYRNFLDYTDEALLASQTAFKRLRELCHAAGYVARDNVADDSHSAAIYIFEKFPGIFEALFDDLNTATALAEFWRVLKNSDIANPDKLLLIALLDRVFALSLDKTEQAYSVEIPKEVEMLLSLRVKARADRNWALSDELRQHIFDLGFIVEDSKGGGYKVHKAL